jgi:ArsR family transcriptional regulator
MRPEPLMPILIGAGSWEREQEKFYLKSSIIDSSYLAGLMHAPITPTLTTNPRGQPLSDERARALFKALADPIRLQIIEALASGERCVCELTSALGLAQSKLSFHLKVLKEAGMLADRQKGRWVYYRLRSEAIEELRSWLAALAAQCGNPAKPCS